MKHLLVIASAIALAACNQRSETTTEAEPGATATATGAMAETPSPASNQAPTGSMAGKYEVTWADGSVMTQTVNPDGTYVELRDGKEARGKWRMDGERSCFDPDGPAPEECYTESARNPDGSFSVVGEAGSRATIRKIGAAPGS